MQKNLKPIPLTKAVETLLAKPNMTDYKLCKILGVSNSYTRKVRLGHIQTAGVKICWRFYEVYGILLDTYNTLDELKFAAGVK